MKRLLYMLVAAITFVACNKSTLNLVPPTSLSSGSFYKNEAEFDQALVGSYSNLRGIAFMAAYMDEMRSDNTFFYYYAADRGTGPTEAMITFMDEAGTSQQVNSPGNRYGNDYSGISKVNTILTRLQASSLSKTAKDRISGEALFLRAFYYFDLVTHYGGVPLQLKEVTDVGGAFLPRNTIDETYAQIIADLNEAIPVLPVASKFPQSGRATQGAAKMLLAYACMSKPTKELAKAEAALKDITKMNYGLLDDYASVFDLPNKNSKESIFEVQYKQGNDGQQSDFIWRFIPRTTNSDLILGLLGSNSNGGLSSGGWNIPTQEMVNSYENNDRRLPASVAVAEGKVTNGLMATSAVKSAVGYVPTAGLDYFYFVKKYLHPPFTVPFNTNDNWPVYRYSGALLLLAECLVSQNKNDEALQYINPVRKRAGLNELSAITADDVANEMRHELAFENHRWTDLIRNGTAIAKVTAKGVTMKSLYPFLLPNTFNVTTNKLLYPIPLREIQINSKLIQNPGY